MGVRQKGDPQKFFKSLPRKLKSSLKKTSQEMAQEVGDEVANAAPVLDGDLSESIEWEVQGDSGSQFGFKIVISSTEPYAKIRDKGGVIKGSPFLAWPVHPDIPRKTYAREVKKNPGAFGFLRTFIPESGGVILGVKDTGRRGPRGGIISSDPEVLFVLAEEVRQDGTGFMTDTVSRYMRKANRKLSKMVRDGLKK